MTSCCRCVLFLQVFVNAVLFVFLDVLFVFADTVLLEVFVDAMLLFVFSDAILLEVFVDAMLLFIFADALLLLVFVDVLLLFAFVDAMLLLQVFVDAQRAIPRHRSLAVFTTLVKTLGPETSLWRVLTLLVTTASQHRDLAPPAQAPTAPPDTLDPAVSTLP